MSTVTVRMKVKPDRHDDFLRILKDVTEAVSTGEPDCFVYATWHTETPYEYLMIEAYNTEAGRELHNERHKGVAAAFFDCLEAPPTVEKLGDVLFGAVHPL